MHRTDSAEIMFHGSLQIARTVSGECHLRGCGGGVSSTSESSGGRGSLLMFVLKSVECDVTLWC